MRNKIVANKYVPPYQSNTISWYERDGLMTYIDALKCKKFLENTDKHFEILNL